MKMARGAGEGGLTSEGRRKSFTRKPPVRRPVFNQRRAKSIKDGEGEGDLKLVFSNLGSTTQRNVLLEGGREQRNRREGQMH